MGGGKRLEHGAWWVVFEREDIFVEVFFLFSFYYFPGNNNSSNSLKT